MKPIRSFLRHPALALTLVAGATLVAGCAGTPGSAGMAAASKEPVTLRVIHFNDLHGNLETAGLTLPHPNPANDKQPLRVRTGGAAAMAGLVKALRASAPHSVVVSNGDSIGGTPIISALFFHESTIDVLNRIGVDLSGVGNHEFDAGYAELLRVTDPKGRCREARPGETAVSCALGPHPGAKFPFIAANVKKADGTPAFEPSAVARYGGVRVAFVGAVTRITPNIVVPSGVAGLTFTDEADAINAEVKKLQAQGIQAIVAVIHEGGNIDGPQMEWNASECPTRRGAIFDIEKRLSPAVDAVLSGHTHQGYRCVIGDRPVMQATALGRGLSVMDLVLDPASGDVDRAKSFHRNLPVLNEHTDPAHRALIVSQEPAAYAQALAAAVPDAAVAARVAEYAARAKPLAERVVGTIGGAFETAANRGNSSAGRLIADAQHAATRAPDRGGARFALMNPGGVRAALACRGTPPCPVTYGDVFTMQPFGNNLVVMTLTGAEIKQMLEDQQRAGRTNPSFLLPSKSLSYRWKAKAPYGQRVEDLRIDGQPVDPNAAIRFTVNSFMADGGDGLSLLRQGRERLGGELDLDALIAFLQTTPSPTPDDRIVVVND